MLGGARRFGAHRGEGRGISWRPPAYSLFNKPFIVSPCFNIFLISLDSCPTAEHHEQARCKALHNTGNNSHLSVLLAISPGGPVLAGTRMSPLWILLKLRMMEVVSDNYWSYKTCKAPVKSPPPTSSFLQAGCLSFRPTNSIRALKEVT